jgi:hypothetical protein
MKLYTEEQVFKAIQMADKYHYLITSEECDIVNSLTPIELPSDEEIEKESFDLYANHNTYSLNVRQYKAFKRGAKFVIDKIQGGEK